MYFVLLSFVADCFKNVKTFVDDVFGGMLVSTIVCSDCKSVCRWHVTIEFMKPSVLRPSSTCLCY